MAKAKRRSSSSGEETKARIVEATLQTLQDEGIVGASARAIARAGDFNQALIFYHFGSVDDAIVAAVGELSRRRLERYRAPLMAVDNLTELIGVARELYENDRASGEITVLAQAFAGASRDDEMGPAMFDYIADWNVLIEEVVQRAIEAGVGRMVTICTRVARFDQVRAIAEQYDPVYCSVGTHPHNADEELDVTADALVQLTRHPKVVAVGEAGLDYYYDNAPRDAQARGLRTHIEAARESGLPLA